MTLDELRRAAELLPPGTSLTLPRDALLAALDEAAAGDDSPAVTPLGSSPAPLLKVEEAASQLKVKPRWLYRHADVLPFTRRIGLRALRFDQEGLTRWLATRR